MVDRTRRGRCPQDTGLSHVIAPGLPLPRPACGGQSARAPWMAGLGEPSGLTSSLSQPLLQEASCPSAIIDRISHTAGARKIRREVGWLNSGKSTGGCIAVDLSGTRLELR